MTLLLLSAVVLQVILPAGLLLWLWRRAPRTRFEWLAGVAVTGSTIAAIAVVTPWSVIPWYLQHAYAAGAGIAAVISWRRTRHAPWLEAIGRRRWAAVASQALVILLMSVVLILATVGMVPPRDERVDLACPLPPGAPYLVVNGGNSLLLNGHLETLQPLARYAPWRGQSYGVDLVQLDRLGRRNSGIAPGDPTKYHIHGGIVTSPCRGTVVSTANDRPDMPVPERDPDRTQLAGNHVMLDCAGIEVLLAHFLRGSVRVTPGDRVATGQALGTVGNSGNTTEPHLHVSAQRRDPGDPLLGGTPVWITIDGTYPVRNDRIRCD